MNSILAGLVGITAGCNNMSYIGAATVGLVSAAVYGAASKLLVRYQIDDPVGAAQVHGFAGVWGLVAVGIFDLDSGSLYSGSLAQLKIQLAGAAALTLWTTCFCWTFFRVLMAIGRFRVSQFYEIIGIDILMHSSLANLDASAFVIADDEGREEGAGGEGERVWTP